MPSLCQSRNSEWWRQLLREASGCLEPRRHALHNAGRPLPVPWLRPSHALLQDTAWCLRPARGPLRTGTLPRTKPPAQGAQWEAERRRRAPPPMVPRRLRTRCGWTRRWLGWAESASRARGVERASLLLTKTSQWLWFGPKLEGFYNWSSSFPDETTPGFKLKTERFFNLERDKQLFGWWDLRSGLALRQKLRCALTGS